MAILRSSARRVHTVGLSFEGPGKAIQSQKEESDINTIVKRFGLTGQLPQNVRTPLNIDFDGVFDFQSAMNVINDAQRAFSAMPADVRKRFGNDPAEFIDFASDPKNQEEARKLGLALPIKVEETPPVIDVRVVSEAVKSDPVKPEVKK